MGNSFTECLFSFTYLFLANQYPAVSHMNAVPTVITLQGMRRHRLLLQISNTPAIVRQLYLHHSIPLQERLCVHLIKVKNDSEMKIIFLLLSCFCFSVILQEAHLNILF